LRIKIKQNEKELNEVELNEIKDEVDQLLVDVIGAPKQLQYKVNEVLSKVIEGKIKIDTALVAIHELVNEGLDPVKMGRKKKQPQRKKKQNKIGNKNKHDLQIEELEKRGWNS
jgi:hypothetical protein